MSMRCITHPLNEPVVKSRRDGSVGKTFACMNLQLVVLSSARVLLGL